MYFFFQAEDGIRDHCVTGVQTCALPICQGQAAGLSQNEVYAGYTHLCLKACFFECRISSAAACFRFLWPFLRSEERRVGKECRSWWSRYRYKKNRGMLQSRCTFVMA